MTIRGHPTRPAAVANLPVSSKRRFLLHSDDNLASHNCQFLEEDLKTPLPKTTTLDDPARLFEIAERGGYLMNLEGRQAIEHAIENERGGVWLRLTDEQYQKLRK